MPLELPSDWNVQIPSDEEVEEAVAAHHGEIVARQIAKFTPEALPWDHATIEETDLGGTVIEFHDKWEDYYKAGYA